MRHSVESYHTASAKSRHLRRSAQNVFLRALSFFSPADLRELYWQFLTGFFCATETLNYDLRY